MLKHPEADNTRKLFPSLDVKECLSQEKKLDRETEPKGYICMYCMELAHAIMAFKKLQDLQSAIWKSRRAGGSEFQSES